MIKKVSYIIDCKVSILEHRLNLLREVKAERTVAVDRVRASLYASEGELNVASHKLASKRCVVAGELQELQDETSRLRQSIEKLHVLETTLETERKQADEKCITVARKLLGLGCKADFLRDRAAAAARKARRRVVPGD